MRFLNHALYETESNTWKQKEQWLIIQKMMLMIVKTADDFDGREHNDKI